MRDHEAFQKWCARCDFWANVHGFFIWGCGLCIGLFVLALGVSTTMFAAGYGPQGDALFGAVSLFLLAGFLLCLSGMIFVKLYTIMAGLY